MSALIYLVGPSFAGKSTWARAQTNATHIHADEIKRRVVGVGPMTDEQRDAIKDEIDSRVEELLMAGGTVILEAWWADGAYRERIRSLARGCGASVHLMVFDNPAEQRERREAHPDEGRKQRTKRTDDEWPKWRLVFEAEVDEYDSAVWLSSVQVVGEAVTYGPMTVTRRAVRG